MEFKFTPEYKVINDLFAREVRYVIPEYQRPYSWGCEGKSDRNNQVNNMWDDLYGYFVSEKKESYFLGSMVLIGNGDRVYQVVDGQQRLTTIVLLFAAIKCFMQEIAHNITGEELRKVAERMIRLVDELTFDEKLHGAISLEKKVKIEKKDGFDYDEVLSKVLDCQRFNKNDYPVGIKKEQIEVAARYYLNKDYFVERLKDNFLTEGNFTEADFKKLNNFLDFIKNKVSVVRILAESFETAYHIFEILNNRGLPLSNKDLFRNFVIREFDALRKEGGSYSELSPTELWATLEKDYDLRDEFLPRWVESVNARQQEYSAFNDLKKIYETQYADRFPKRRIELLYSDIKRDLGYFTAIVNNELNNPALKAKINVLLHASNSRYTLNYLLAAWRHLDGRVDNLLPLVNAYEIFLLHKCLKGRFVSAPVYGAISNLKEGKTAAAIAVLAPPSVKQELKDEVNNGNLDNDAAKLLLCKWIWLHESKTSDDLVQQQLDFGKASLEHIIPQSPQPGTNWTKDFSDEFLRKFTYKLGNMTLLTVRLNSEARNYDFSRKKAVYLKTKLSITQELASQPAISPEYLEERHRRITSEIFEDLGI